ncbi:MAG: LacI family DNA-binding transcriptional regulator [Verrucomicrobia bacterium]|nr:LacI family DNA-binding transcriptional regulator [Verrucomicrobiota bacterium]
MRDLGNKLSRITRMVEAAKADAWVVYAAPNEVIRWFSSHSAPALAMGRVPGGLQMASAITDLSEALHAAVRELTRHGHRRIVAVSPESWRVPEPSNTAKRFLTAMKANGHQPSNYNLPNWECTPAGLENLLNSLFQITPPTALLFVDPAACVAALGFLGRRGLLIPRDVSILCMTSGPMFDLLPQRLAHFEWPIDSHIHRIVRWVGRVAMGEIEKQETIFPAIFHPGETIGPASHGA